ncbi:MAG TPA: glycosyltransferase family 4 protein [Gemmatimonadales bacterium]|nr:glycosyltransferase family 4 protein [Gemmatimonadales bacterium]
MAASSQRRLHVVIAAPGRAVGGHARAAGDIVRGFTKDPEISIELQPIDPRLSGVLRGLTEWKFIRSVIRPLLYCGGLIRAAARADVIHVFAAAHTAFLFGALPAVVIARLRRRPVVLNYHDGRAEAHFRWWGPLLRWAARRAAVLVFPSTYLQEVFRRHGIDGVVVTNVVDTSAFSYRRPERVRPRLVSARLLEPLYGIDNTLRAFALLKSEAPDAVLDIYGGGTAARALRRAVGDLGLSDVQFHGEVPHRAMPAVLAQGGILVNSSRVDNMPHVIIEAFAAGVPVVTTAAGGIPRIVEDGRTGLLVPVDRPAALAAAVLRVLREPGLAGRLAAEARRECARYRWSQAKQGWRQVYRRVTSVAVRPHS